MKAKGRNKRSRLCNHCRQRFVPDDQRKLIAVCPFCHRETWKSTVGISDLKKLAWKQFSVWIRRRDSDKHGYCRCVTCGMKAHWTEMQAGHFLASRCKGILFLEQGVHAQCPICNKSGGRFDDYWVFMEERYGRKEIERQRKAKWNGESWTKGELIAIELNYRTRLERGR